MAHTYSHLYRLPTTGLRFFTVYGPWGRPDMALFLFTRAILDGRPIDVFNHSKMQRDFTYSTHRRGSRPHLRQDRRAGPGLVRRETGLRDQQRTVPPDNIGNHQPVELLRLIAVLEAGAGSERKKNLLPLQMGDVPQLCGSSRSSTRRRIHAIDIH